MEVKVSIDSVNLLNLLRKTPRRQAYAIRNALNKTADVVQAAEVRAAREKLTMRDPTFTTRNICSISPRASLSSLSVTMRLRSFGHSFTAELETGGERLPTRGPALAWPLTGEAARPSWGAEIPANFKWKALAFHGPTGGTGRRRRRAAISSSAGVREGSERTYLVPGVGVFRRGYGHYSRLVYAFLSHVRIPRRLGWVGIARTVIAQTWGKLLTDEVIEAFEHDGWRVRRL